MSKLSESEKDVGGVKVGNRKIFTQYINENLAIKAIPGILAQSQELSAMRVRTDAEFAILKRIRCIESVKESLPKDDTKKKNKKGEPQQPEK